MRRDQSNDDRGTGRIEAFSDGVIAVAITLLILDVHVPSVQTELLQALLKQWPTYLGYVTSFLVITIFGPTITICSGISSRSITLIDLIYGLPIRFLHFGRLDIFSVGAQPATEDHLPHTPAKNELPEAASEPE